MTPQEMIALGDRYLASLARPDGTLVGYSRESAALRLVANGLVPSELDYEQLCTAIAVAGKTSFLPTFICEDQEQVWRWCADLLLKTASTCRPNDLGHDRTLIGIAVKSALARDRHIVQLHPYVAYPMLELSLRRALPQFVDGDGLVLQKFDVRTIKGGRNAVKPGDHIFIGQLLGLLHETAPPLIKDLLTYLGAHIERHYTDKTWEFKIAEWRNASMHGVESFFALAPGIFSLALLVQMYVHRDNFEAAKAERLAALKWREANPSLRDIEDY